MTTEMQELLARAAVMAAEYVSDRVAEIEGSVFPSSDAVAALDGFSTALPEGSSDPSAVLEQLHRLGSPATVRSTGGRYFGFVNGGTEPIGTAAAILSTTWDQNLALPVMSPVGARLDAIAARWVVELLGLGEQTEAAFCAGASVANLTAILAARDALLHRAGWSVATKGLVGAPRIPVATTAEVHVSVIKALRVAGIGTDAITYVPTDDCGRLLTERLPDFEPGSLVIVQAGNVNTGHSDPFGPVVDAVRRVGGWVHVDGAFGLWAAAAPTRQHLVAGVENADSWATDAHKWLNAPYDAGIVACARGEDLRRAMAVDAAYLSTDSERALMHLGLQMSQRARGIETWAILATRGRSGIAELVESSCTLASMMAEQLADGGAEILAPVVLNQALAHFGDDETTDAVIDAVQRDGTCWVGGTTWQGRRAMRLSVSDSSTTEDDIARSTSAILRCRQALDRR